MFVGIVPLFDVNAIALFDSGATHSFVASSFVQAHKLEMTKDDKGWNISIPIGVNQIVLWVCSGCPLILGHLTLPADLIVLDMRDFDIILGMDWLSEHHAFIDCREKRVLFEIPGEGTCYYEGVRVNAPKASSAKLTCVLGEIRSEGYLVSIQEVD